MPHIQRVLSSEGQRDEVTVRVEHSEGVTSETAPAAVATIRQAVTATIGVEFVPAESIERSVGTMRRVVGHRSDR